MRYSEEDKQKLEQISLDILKEFIRICEKYDLKYFAAFGTAIGAVRHQGFIPWDDDMDVVMLREDYDKFIKIAKTEMSDSFELYSAHIQKRVQGFYIQMSKKGTVFMTKWNNRWPLHPGIKLDIFPYDCVPAEGKKRAVMYKKFRFWNRLYIIRNVKVPYFPGNSPVLKVVRGLCTLAYYIMNVTGPSIDRIVNKCTSVMTSYRDKSSYLTMFDDLHPDQWIIRRDEIEPLQDAEFEGIKIKLPNKNHEILTRMYGDYMVPPPEEQRDGHDLEMVHLDETKDEMENRNAI